MIPKRAFQVGGPQGFGTQLKCKIKGKDRNKFREAANETGEKNKTV